MTGTVAQIQTHDGGMVYLSAEDVMIFDAHQQEIAYWHESEWNEDPEAAVACLNAVALAIDLGAVAVKERLSP